MRIRASVVVGILLAGVVSPAAAKALISVNKTVHDADTVFEGTADAVSCTFRIRNNGDEPLTIKSVRPGCGCTVVEYDTTILPGREGTLTPRVTIKGMHAGAFNKSVTVESNAANEPRLMLSIKGVVVPVIEVSTTYITLQAGAPYAKNPLVTLRTRKKDLRIVDVVFEPGQSGGAGSWRSTMPLLPTFELKRADKPITGGMLEDTLRMSVQAELNEALSGTFRISTNHPQKPEITIAGRVIPPPQ